MCKEVFGPAPGGSPAFSPIARRDDYSPVLAEVLNNALPN